MNDRCQLITSLASRGPAPVPLRPCCMAALVALHNRNLPDTTWLCPVEEQENDHDRPPDL
jgi:hypothetical protein